MKVYTKPDFTVYHFDVKDYVATCENPTSYSAVNVDCLIKSGDAEGVFYNDGLNICTYYATSSNLITLNGVTYLYWYGSADGQPATGGTNEDGSMYGQVLMTALTNAGVSGTSGSNVLHAGVATTSVTQLINQST